MSRIGNHTLAICDDHTDLQTLIYMPPSSTACSHVSGGILYCTVRMTRRFVFLFECNPRSVEAFFVPLLRKLSNFVEKFRREGGRGGKGPMTIK